MTRCTLVHRASTLHRHARRALGAMLLVPLTLRAQAPSASKLVLDDVVRAALETGLDLRLALRALASSEAGRAVAGAPFESQLRVSATSATDRALQEATSSAPSTSILSTTNTRYGVNVDKLLRSGVIVSPSLAVTRAAVSSATLPPPNRASVNLGLTVPVMRGWGNSALRGFETSATSDAEAGDFDVRHAAAKSVMTAVSAYWDYVAAYRRLDVQKLAERRANELAAETKLLVSADERSASELHSLDANAALKRISRFAAEQAVLEARQRLGIALGISADDIWKLGTPASDFPSVADVNPPDGARADSLAMDAPSRRADLAAARARRASAAALQDGYAADTKSKLDVVIVAGYAGGERGSAFRQYYSSIYQGVAGLNSTVQINYQPSLSNAGARGRLEQAEASVDRSSIVLADLTRTAVIAARVAAEGLRGARLQLETAEIAVGLSEQSVASEMTKFRMGMSTRFDVIQTEDALTGALQSRIAAQVLAAQALVRLRFESGRLLRGDDIRTLRVDVPSLLHAGANEW